MANKEIKANLKKEQDHLFFKSLQNEYAAYRQSKLLPEDERPEKQNLNYNMWHGLSAKKPHTKQ